jgi:hypothetical protein
MMNSTNFLNGQERVIRMGPRGGFYALKKDGSKKRNPIARFRKAADGSLVRLTKANLPKVPEAIRPARAAAAKATPKPRGMSNSAKATKMFQTILAKGPRKVRKNKGVARKKAPTPMAAPNARKARMNAMALKRAAGAMPAPRRRIRATPKPRGRKPMSNSAMATKLFQAILNKKAPARKPKAAKVAAKNVIVVSPRGTLYKSKRSQMALNRAKAQKKLRQQNPYAALNNALRR